MSYTFRDCFWDTSITLNSNGIGDVNDANVIGKTTAEMKNVATFTDESTVGLDDAWDFVNNPMMIMQTTITGIWISQVQ